jgi:hypothetical protein
LNFSDKNITRTTLISSGIIFLILSYLCFKYIIPGFKVCGSGCEYWWTWIIPSSLRDGCLAVCIDRNGLYRPFMVIGAIMLLIEFFFELLILIKYIILQLSFLPNPKSVAAYRNRLKEEETKKRDPDN